MPDLLAQLDAAADWQDKATPGPWEPVRSQTCGHLRAAHNYDDNPLVEWTSMDIGFITEARSLPLRAIAEELRRLRADNERFRAELERLQEVVEEADYELIEAALKGGA